MPNVRIFLIIGLSLLIIGVVGMIATFPESINKEFTSTTEEIDADGIHDIHIETENAQIMILPTNEEVISAIFEGTEDKDLFSTEVKNNQLTIRVKDKAWNIISLDFFQETPNLTVFLPVQQYKMLDVETDNGEISIEDISVGNIKVKSSNGKISTDKLAVDTLTARTYNGSIHLTDLAAIQTEFKTDNGKVVLRHVDGDISGKTSNGSIRLDTENLEDSLDFNSANGKITIISEELPTNNTFDLRTDFGSIEVFGEKDWDATVGQGKTQIKMRTNNGSITIKQAE